MRDLLVGAIAGLIIAAGIMVAAVAAILLIIILLDLIGGWFFPVLFLGAGAVIGAIVHHGEAKANA